MNTLLSSKSIASPQLCIPVIGIPQSKTFKSAYAATKLPMVPPPYLYGLPINYYTFKLCFKHSYIAVATQLSTKL